MLRREPKQMSFHSELYNKIPENHILRRPRGRSLRLLYQRSANIEDECQLKQ
ncbi:hypothetical protein [Anaerobacillus alkalidiazotrophicus]|uniref:hypothetical protein n=1 Tax=Anaerobacillus alkalidiazotrophicus TaxID=472963 RepID=UPI0014719E7F|nr:hypothetical protein [Anaerobacillus alkalidiazotrophicus]